MINSAEFLEAAELYYGATGRIGPRQSLTYRRFETLAAAVKFAVEELEPGSRSLTIQSGEFDFKGNEIDALYQSTDFPLDRKPAG